MAVWLGRARGRKREVSECADMGGGRGDGKMKGRVAQEGLTMAGDGLRDEGRLRDGLWIGAEGDGEELIEEGKE